MLLHHTGQPPEAPPAAFSSPTSLVSCVPAPFLPAYLPAAVCAGEGGLPVRRGASSTAATAAAVGTLGTKYTLPFCAAAWRNHRNEPKERRIMAQEASALAGIWERANPSTDPQLTWVHAWGQAMKAVVERGKL